uniref:Venom peptide HsVx1-like isoform X1 n=1 Tax=Diabrotica virgifera virgifera TaxID=50390 RepID=A0A6P7FTW6_DIAVI
MQVIKMKMIAVLVLCVVVAVNARKITECRNFPGVGTLKVGEEKSEQGACNIIKCKEGGTISKKSCGSYEIAPPCTIVDGDQTKLFPECCPKYRCPVKN